MSQKKSPRLRKGERMDSQFNELDLLEDSAEQTQQQDPSNLPSKPRRNRGRKKNDRSSAKDKGRNIQKKK